MLEGEAERYQHFQDQFNEQKKLFWMDMGISLAPLIPAGAVTLYARTEMGSFELTMASMTLSISSWLIAGFRCNRMLSSTRDFIQTLK